MALIPSGRVKVMHAQSVRDFDALKEVFAQMTPEDAARPGVTQQNVGGPDGSAGAQAVPASSSGGAPTGVAEMTPDPNQMQQPGQPGGDAAGQALDVGQQPQQVDDQKFQNSLTKYVLHKIVEWKWPERLAVSRQEEMVDEKILPDGHRNFTILVPNTYYGGDVISNEDFQRFIQELTQKFGIHFQGASRKGKKATLNFSTTQKEMQLDPMSDIYGTKGSGATGGAGGASRAKAAYTMGEILTARRNDLYETMRKIACQMEKK